MTPAFGPIAIVGRGCVLPEALDPDSLWRIVADGRDVLGVLPEGRWRLDPAHVLADAASAGPDQSWSDRGGYVRDFERVFDADGFALPADELLGLDPVFRWLLHAGRAALRDAGLDVQPGSARRGLPVGLVLGNLSYPSRAHAAFAEQVWLRGALPVAARPAGADPDPRNRFSSGLPAHLAAAALGLGGDAFCLDAACASSLYAIKLACDRLHRHEADLMLAGAVNCADDLLIHIGFSALQALSRSGRSRPFHRAADGLVPAEGAVIVALKRLDDAVRAGDRIAGVIRGVGLSNDGRSGGFLAPSSSGQVAALRAAYVMAGIDPGAVSLLECHATGTTVGDAVEIASSAEVFARCAELPVGSHKSNFGHLIATAGAAGLLKVLEAIRHRERPATLHAEPAAEGIAGTPLRLLHRREPWDCDGPRIAGVSAFGFGGNNAHLVVEEYGGAPVTRRASRRRRPAGDPVVVVAMDAITAAGPHLADLVATLAMPVETPGRVHAIDRLVLDRARLRFPPHDVAQALPQQLAMLALALRLSQRTALDASRLGVYVGMGCDPLVSRHGLRWRLRERLHEAGLDVERLERDGWLSRARDAIAAELSAAALLGGMPNIPANRINVQLDALGPGFTVSAEELSGLRALELAARALDAGEIEAALVGAVDFCCDPVHAAAPDAVLPESRRTPGDAGVMLVLKRRSAALRDGDEVLAVVDTARGKAVGQGFGPGEETVSLTPRIGHAHAASGLLHVVAAVFALHRRRWFPNSTAPGTAWLAGAERSAEVQVDALGGQRATVRLRAAPGDAQPRDATTSVVLHRGADAADVLRALRAGEPGAGPAAVAIAACDAGTMQTCRAHAAAFLADRPDAARCRVAPGIHWSPRPLDGELAFVFTGAAAAYPGMGAPLLEAMPWLTDDLLARFPVLARTQHWLARGTGPAGFAPFDTLQGCTLLCQLHAVFTRHHLGLRPQAVLGVSSGETNGVVAMGAWTDLGALFEDIDRSGMYTREIAGEYGVLRRAWGAQAPAAIDWVSYRVLEPPEAIERAIGADGRVAVSMVNAPADCIVSGPGDACRDVVSRLDRARVIALGADIVAHRPELAGWRDEWRRIHDRETRAVPGVRFYANATGTWYAAERDAIADALTGQAIRSVDFRTVVEAAWADGVRVFLEHGPRGSCTRWIGEVLGEREHLAMSLDTFGAGVEHTLDAIAALAAAGVEMTLARCATVPAEDRRDVAVAAEQSLVVPAHWPAIRFEAFSEVAADAEAVQVMAPAPALAPVGGAGDFEAVARLSAPRPAMPAAQPVTAAPDPLTAELIEMHRSVGAAHRVFLAQQAHAVTLLARLAQTAPAAPDVVAEGPPAVLVAVPTTGSVENGPDAEPPIPLRAAARAMSREQLEIHASGRIADVFGPAFAGQDAWPRQVRMPEPPLLLADRVLGIDGEPGTLGRGRVWTETDVHESAWYLDRGHMPAGVMIEAGQADLLLISWLGIDTHNRGERVYRLLGADLTFHGGLPRPGDTLGFDIRVVDYARQGDVTLFFFASECHIGEAVRLTVRNGQAGFFSDAELAASAGVAWSPGDATRLRDGPLAAPAVDPWRTRFDAASVAAFAAGRVAECFGPGYAWADAHLRTPAIPTGNRCLFDEVEVFDPRGGPWGRGYLRAIDHVDPGAWHMLCHFKQDPCMPGTLMFEAALQGLAFYLAAMGFTLDRDGWRFEPVPDQTYRLRCRGQVTPSSRTIVYELFVHEVAAGPEPTIYADVLGTVDGLRAFHCERLGLRLVRGFPLDSRQPAGAAMPAVADIPYDRAALLECAWGRLSRVFDERFAVFDGARRGVRLPGPPYDCVSRITAIETAGEGGRGSSIVAEYEVPVDAWYFEENGAVTMPACVLLEVALQPCGCLAVHMGAALAGDTDLHFRNLDGQATQHFEIRAGGGVIETRAVCTSKSRVGDMTLLGFDVECRCDGRLLYEIRTGFGFFSPAALRSQVGLPLDDPLRECTRVEGGLDAEQTALGVRPARFFAGSAQLPGAMLCLLDRIVAFLPDGGAAGLGYLRAESDVSPAKWFFRAHFYEDPVQPGSLGVEAVAQLLQFYLLASGEAAHFTTPRFEPIALGEPLIYKYRGQVVPTDSRVEVAADILERGRDHSGAYVRARATFRVDGRAIYEIANIGMRLCEDRAGPGGTGDAWDATLGARVARLVDAALRRSPGGVCTGLRHGEFNAAPPAAVRARALPVAAGRMDAVLEHWDATAERFRVHASARVFVAEGYGVPDPPRRRGEMLTLEDPGPVEAAADPTLARWIGALVDGVCGALGRLPGAAADAVYGLRSLRLHRTPAGAEALEAWIEAAGEALRVEVLAQGRPLADLVLGPAVSGEAVGPRDAAAPQPVDAATVRTFWRERLGTGAWIGEDLMLAMTEQFVAGIGTAGGTGALHGRAVVYLANHQVAVESLLFTVVMSALGGIPTAAVAKREHARSWLGRLLGALFPAAGTKPVPELMVLVDRDDAQATWACIQTQIDAVARGCRSLLIHAEGTRSLSARRPVQVLSSAIVDRCVEAGVAIVPVRFAGGLPIEPAAERLDFPVGYGRQTWWLGAPIDAACLRDGDSASRRERVLQAIAQTGPSPHAERPQPPDRGFGAAVASHRQVGTEAQAVLRALAERHGFAVSPMFEWLLDELR